MSTPPTLKQKTSSLAWQVSFRLLLALGLSAIIVAVMSAVLVQTFQNKTALREANNTVNFFENAIQDQEQSWEEAAIRYRGRIEFMHLLENPATRWERLTSYLTTQATGATFPDVLITNAQDRILFRFGFGETDTPTLFPHKGEQGWYYQEQSKTLYRYFVQSIWLGKEGMGHLILARPLDNAWLYQLTLPDTHLFVRWHAQTVASSLGEQGQHEHLGNEDGLVDHDGQQYGQGRFAWEKGKQDTPEIVTHHRVDAIFTLKEVFAFALVAMIAISLALWAAVGFWMARTTRRIQLLKQASQEFVESHQASTKLEAYLRDACSREDEINAVATSMGTLISEVVQHNAERDVYETQLRDSEANVRQITSVMGDGLYVLDRDGNVTFFNLEAERLLGWSEAELLGRNGHKIFHYQTPDGQPITVADCPVHRTIRTGNTYRSKEDWLVRRDGSMLPVSIVSSPIIENGEVAGSVASFHDITQRLEAEKALREREARFRLLFNSGNDAILVHLLNATDGRGKFIEVNNVACKRLGYSRDELLQMSPADIDDPESASDMTEIARQIQAHGHALFERVHVTKGGEKIPVEVSSHVFEMNGTPLLMSVVRDISERKQSELEYKAILQTARDGFLVVDARDGSFIDVNDAYCNMLGYTREEMLQLRTPDVEAQETPEEIKAHIKEMVAQGYSRFETRHRCKSGRVIDVEVSLQYLDIKGGVFITFIRDISEHKLTQERINHMAHYDELTGLPNRALFYDRLRQALSMAKRNNGGLALMYMDLDGFKKVNDTLGHHAGDLVLMEVADRLRQCVRESDTVARLGGDEFTVILNETHKHDDVAGVAEKIIEAISPPFELEGYEARIGISIGIARYSEEASSEDELMNHADQAMYAAKSAGKNTYRFNSEINNDGPV